MSNYWTSADYSTPGTDVTLDDGQGRLVLGVGDEPYLVTPDGTVLDEEEWMP